MHLDITFGLQVVESSSLVVLKKNLAIPISPFFHLLVIFNIFFSISIQMRFLGAP